MNNIFEEKILLQIEGILTADFFDEGLREIIDSPDFQKIKEEKHYAVGFFFQLKPTNRVLKGGLDSQITWESSLVEITRSMSTEDIKKCIIQLFTPKRFAGTNFDYDTALERMNEVLYFYQLKIILNIRKTEVQMLDITLEEQNMPLELGPKKTKGIKEFSGIFQNLQSHIAGLEDIPENMAKRRITCYYNELMNCYENRNIYACVFLMGAILEGFFYLYYYHHTDKQKELLDKSKKKLLRSVGSKIIFVLPKSKKLSVNMRKNIAIL